MLAACAAVMCILAGPAAGSAAAQPVNNFPPEVVGNAQVGERVVCGAGSWSGSVSQFSYTWLRDAVPIASGVTYTISVADKGHSIWCIVTASGGEGSAEAESVNSLEIPGGKPATLPENVTPPAVSGSAAVGETLSCSTGTWNGSPAPTFSYQWVRDAETIIPAATASMYKVAGEDQGHSLACTVTARNTAGSASASSIGVRVPGSKPVNQVAPRVLGVEPASVGESLTCAPGSWSASPAPTFSYQWVRDSGLPGEAPITSAKSSTYTVEAGDQLHLLACRVTATNSEGSGEAVSANSLRVAGSKPQNIEPPNVSGTASVGATLTCERGTWSGLPAPTYSYLWVRDEGLAGEEAISSATSSTYTGRLEDRGHSLSCDVTATNSEGSASQSSEKVVVPAGGGGTPPQNQAAPAVLGSASLGATLTCSEGTWSGSPTPTLTYQWLRDGSGVAFATASTYVVAEADQGHKLACKVAAINDEGVASQLSSNVLEIPGVPPESSEPPQVSGTPATGQPLTCLKGRWGGRPAPTFTYQWLRDGSAIATATASSYVVTGDVRGHVLSCRVSAQNSVGRLEASSANSVEIPGGRPRNTAAPEVSGSPAVGSALTCSPGTWNAQPAATYAYQWQVNGVDIPSATSSEYTVVGADRGLVLACKVTASNREGSEAVVSRGVHVPGTAPEVLEAPQVSGSPAVGQALTCVHGSWAGKPPPAFTYQWLRDGAPIAGAASSTYTVELADEGHSLSCIVTATNSQGRAEAQSANSAAVARPTISLPTRPQLTPFTFAPLPSGVTSKVLAALRVHMGRVQHRARLAGLRKKGLYAFAFASPAAGRLEFIWYQALSGVQHSTTTKPPVLAYATASFSSPGTKTVTLRLTAAGRRLIARSARINLTFKGLFAQPHERPVTLIKTYQLSH